LTTSSPSIEHPTLHIELSPQNSEQLINLCGQFNNHLSQIETELNVIIKSHGYHFNISGRQVQAQKVINILLDLYKAAANEMLTPNTVHLRIQQSKSTSKSNKNNAFEAQIRTKRKVIRARGDNQNAYIRNMQRFDLTFGIGPAGTGKTYLAVAAAVEALESDEVRRLILVRPAVEAGERLGFLPGDLSQKIDPYMRPMYDAMYEFMGVEKVTKLIERNVIEVAPLAYMRGRTLNDSFILMDEAQNTTSEQMKMFLTRIGFGSTAVVTGDITQIDLASNQTSGLKSALHILQGIKDISFNHFEAKDVVRHTLVQRIVEAYSKLEKDER